MSGVGSQGPHPCLVCKDVAVHEVIRTVTHYPTPAEARS